MLMVYIQSEYILKHSKLLRRAGWNQAKHCHIEKINHRRYIINLFDALFVL